MVTPFNAQGQIDFEALERTITHIINGGVEFLVALGTTGESVTLSQEEKTAVLDFVVEKAAGRAVIVAGFGGNDTAALVKSIEEYHFKGIDAILSVNPSYNKPTQEGIFQHFMAVEKASPRPIILYNVPSRTASNITAETTLRLAHASDKFMGIKESSGDFRQLMEIAHRRPSNFMVFCGDDNIALPSLSLGADGLISVIGNAFPQETSDMVRAALAGDYAAARQLHYKLMYIVDLLFVDGNPAGVKCVMDLLNICEPFVRLPLTSVREETRSKLQQLVLGYQDAGHAQQR